MTLSKQQILDGCEKIRLIEPYQKKNIQTCSYDLTFSGEYQMYDPKNNGQNKRLEKGEMLIIPAHAICFVLTNEIVNIPYNLTASISLSLSLIKSGVMLAAQPPYDAGYSGKTLALLHNLSSEPVAINVDQHILNIVFNKLALPVNESDLYSGDYNNAENLNDFKIKPQIKGGVFELSESLHKQEKSFNKFIPSMLTAITIIVGVITILVTFFSAGNIMNGWLGTQNGAQLSAPENEMRVPVSSLTEEDEIIIYIKGQGYKIDLENMTISKFPSNLNEEYSGE